MIKTFDILVFSNGADGKTHQQSVNGVKAASAKELRSLYAMTDEKIEIVREYEDESDVKRNAAEREKVGTTSANQQASKQKIKPVKPVEEFKAKPQFFTVGGVECKYDGGKVFQKQWIKLGPPESDNYRIVSDSSNKLVSLTGKHIEKLTWVQIENASDEN